MAAARPTRVTSKAVEKNVQLQRQVEIQRRELNEFANENAKLLSAANAQVKIEARRRLTQQQICRNEQEYESRLRQEEYQRRLQNRVVLQNQALATELDKQTAEEERKLREIQRICEESPELRDLERALRTAYLNKERAAQCEEKIILATREQERIQAIEDQIEVDRLRAIQTEREKITDKKVQCTEQRKLLQQQINEKQEQLREIEFQKELDRQMVEDIVNQINKEDEAEMQKKREMQAAARQMIKQFEEQRRRELEAARAAAKAEEDAILAYNKRTQERSNDFAAKVQAKKDEEDRILRKIVEETERKRKEEEEFINLRDMLWEEELELKRQREVQGRIEKQAQMKKEMMDVNSRMLVAKEEFRKKEAENEARLVMAMRKKFAEDEARERMDEENRRQNRIQYMNMIEEQKKQRKAIYESERAQELLESEEAIRKEEYRKHVIREARKRLIAEHANKLKGYLPPGALSNQEEYELLNQF